MPTTPPQTEQIARLVEGSRAQDELLAQGTRELRARWATIHADWSERAEAALESGAPDAGQPPQPADLPKLIAQMERLLDRVAAGEAALLGGEVAGGDEALRVRAVRLLNESLAKHIASALNPLQHAMLTGDADLTAAAHRALESAQSRVDRALQEVPMVHAREVQTAHAEELGADRFIYLGPSDGRNRPFCADKVGKSFTREEIALLDNGQGLDVMTRCGGWGCRHHWRAMPLAYEGLSFLAVDEDAFARARMNDISAWDQSFIERGVEPSSQDFVNMLRHISQHPNDELSYIAQLLEGKHISFKVVTDDEFAKLLNSVGDTAQDAQGVTLGTVSYIPRPLLRATLVGHELTHAYLAYEREAGLTNDHETIAEAGLWEILRDVIIDEEVTAHLVEDSIRLGLGLETLFPDASEDDIIDYIDKIYDEHVNSMVDSMRRKHGR